MAGTRMRLTYAERAAALEEAVASRLAGCLKLPPIACGIDAAALLPERSDDAALARAALAAGIETQPLSAFALDRPAPSGLVLGFAPFTVAQIETGVRQLARVLEAVLASGTTSRKTARGRPNSGSSASH